MGKLTIAERRRCCATGMTSRAPLALSQQSPGTSKDMQASTPSSKVVQVTFPEESKAVVKVLDAAATVEVSDSESDDECNVLNVLDGEQVARYELADV